MIIEQNGEAPKKLAEVLLVGIDDNGEDKFTLVVGKKDVEKKETDILNIIQGHKARAIYRILTTHGGEDVPEVK